MPLPCTPVVLGEELEETIFKGGEGVMDLPAYYHEAEGVVLTRWRLTQDEKEIFQRSGGDIYLWVWTFGNPLQPVRITVESPIRALETENTIIEETDESRYDISQYSSYEDVANDEELAAEFLEKLKELRNGNPITLLINPLEAWMLLGTLQLVLRHPLNTGPSSQSAKQLAMQIQKAIAAKGVLKLFAEMGWQEKFDYEEKKQ